MKMKKILLVNNGYPSDYMPSYTTYMETIKDCLVKAGYTVDLLVIRYNCSRSILYMAFCYLSFWLKCIVKNLTAYEVVYVNHAPFAWPLFFNPTFHEQQTYIHWHGDEAVKNSLFLRKTRSLIHKKLLKCHHITPSAYFKHIVSHNLNISQACITVSPSGGVNVETFIESVKSFNPSSRQFILGFSSGMSKGKGAELIMSLISCSEIIEKKINRKLLFRIIDYGNDMPEYRERLTNSKSVELVPKMPKNEMPKFYNEIDLLLMSSRRSESLGLVVLEAMSCGKPVVSFNMFAFPEFVVPDLSGELVRYSNIMSENVDNFIIAIGKIHDNYSSYRPRSIVVERYSENKVVEQYKMMFK